MCVNLDVGKLFGVFLSRQSLGLYFSEDILIKIYVGIAIVYFPFLTLILLTWTKWRAPTNASKWRMGFNPYPANVDKMASSYQC